MGSSFIKGFIVFLMLLLVFPTFGKSNETRPNRFFLQVFDKLFKSREKRQAECAINDSKCLFIRGSEEGESSSEDTLQQCALDLCGPPNPETSFDSYSYFDSDISHLDRPDLIKKWQKEYQDLGLREIMKNWVDEEMGSFKDLQKAFEERDISRESGFDYLKPEDYSKLGEILFYGYIETDIDENRPLSNRLTIHINLPEEASQQLKEGVESYAQDLKKKANSSFYNQTYYGIYTPQEAYTVLQSRWESVKKKYAQEKKSKGSFNVLNRISKQMDEMRTQIEQLAEEIKNPSVGVYGIHSQKRILLEAAIAMKDLEETFKVETTGSRPKAEEQLLCRQKACQQGLKEMIGEVFDYYGQSPSRKDIEDRYSVQCLSKFVQFKQLEKELRKGLNIPDVQRDFSDKILKKFSKPTRESFENYINNGFDMGPPMSTSQGLKTSLQGFSSVTEGGLPMANEGFYKDKGNVELIFDMYYQKNALEYGNDNPCTWFFPEGDDAFISSPSIFKSEEGLSQQMEGMSSKGAINLSLFSCLHPHHGQGVASHEMAHLLSWLFMQNKLSEKSYGSYKKLRECATKRYKHLKAPSIQSDTHENDQLKTEEDTADLISYLAVPDKKSHYSCALLSITAAGTQYKETDLLNNGLKGFSPHSNSLLRVLFEAIHKRVELSSACKRVVEHYKDDIDFTPCF